MPLETETPFTTLEWHNFFRALEITSICRQAQGLNGAFAVEVHVKGKQVDISRTK